MAGYVVDEFNEYSDGALDDLPDDDLYELETAAILSTQHQKSALLTSPQALSRNAPHQTNRVPSYKTNPHSAPAKTNPEPPSSDYGYDDEIVVDLDEEIVPENNDRSAGFSNEPRQWVPNACIRDGYPSKLHLSNNSYSGPGLAFKGRSVQGASNVGHSRVEESYGDKMEVDSETLDHEPAANELQRRVQELEREKESLLKSVQEAKSAVMSKAGEILIVRKNQEKVTKDYERRISLMQQAHADIIAKQKAELERTKKDREVIETNNLFLEHDLAREAEKAKQRKQSVKDGAGNKANASPAVTPKRHQIPLRHRDGFEDDDIARVSPSKARDRAKAVTPKQGGKRKRFVLDQSPIQPLQLSEPRVKAKPQVTNETPNQELDLALLAKLEKDEHRFEFMRKLLNHRPSSEHERTFEGLTHHAFPSSPSKILSSLVYDQLATYAPESQAEGFPLRFSHIFMGLWEQCLTEGYYAPIYLLVDSIKFILATDKMGTAISITEKALPLILASVDLVAIPIARASTNPAFIPDRDAPLQIKLRSEIDVLECLSLLHTIATSCVISSEAITTFWQCMPNDFVLLMLMIAQPLPQIMLMLQVLSTSALPGTIGAIVPVDSGPDQQTKRETNTIERLTLLLFENPETLPDSRTANTTSNSYNPVSTGRLRVQVLQVLGGLCVHQYGGRVLARHRHCIGRLVRFLHDQIDALYDYTTVTHSVTVESINLTTRILHHLITNFPEDIDMRAKLGVIQGGSHKHLVALTRLAFSEALVLEAGIEPEVADAAHQLLDMYLSPEEGEALLQVFSSGKSAA